MKVIPSFKASSSTFINKDGVPSDIVIIAGSNGVGKSVLLKEIYNFTSANPNDTDNEGIVVYDFKLSQADITLLSGYREGGYFMNAAVSDIYITRIDYNMKSNWDRYTILKNMLTVTRLCFLHNLFLIMRPVRWKPTVYYA